jgi:hypothetical protein
MSVEIMQVRTRIRHFKRDVRCRYRYSHEGMKMKDLGAQWNRVLVVVTIIAASYAALGCKQSAPPPPVVGSGVAPAAVERAPPADHAPSTSPGGVSSSADYQRVSLAIMERATVIYREPDCDKLASELAGFVDENQAAIAAIDSWQKAHPEDDHGWMKRSVLALPPAQRPAAEHRLEELHEFNETALLGINRCASIPAMKAALRRIPDGVDA